jgi:hypothetical protein
MWNRLPSETCSILVLNATAVPFKEPLPANSPAHKTVIGQYYFRFERNNAMNAMETIDREPCICIKVARQNSGKSKKKFCFSNASSFGLPYGFSSPFW